MGSRRPASEWLTLYDLGVVERQDLLNAIRFFHLSIPFSGFTVSSSSLAVTYTSSFSTQERIAGNCTRYLTLDLYRDLELS